MEQFVEPLDKIYKKMYYIFSIIFATFYVSYSM